MEKHRRPRGGQNSAPRIDGMVRSGRTLGVPTSSSYQPNREKPTPSMGNFSGHSDGFYPARQTARGIDRAEEDEAQLLDEPIVLDHIPPKKPKTRFWARHGRLKRN